MRVIDKPNMKGLIFFLFLLAHTTMVLATPIILLCGVLSYDTRR